MNVYSDKIRLLISNYPLHFGAIAIGTILVGIGLLLSYHPNKETIHVLSETDENNTSSIMVEVVGGVKNPGVYTLSSDARVIDLLDAAGGLYDEDSDWVDRFVNKVERLKDGQKIVIQKKGSQSDRESANYFIDQSSGSYDQGSDQIKYVNINTASQSELESLWGIGPVYAKNIIEQRPYSDISELIEKNVIKQNVFDRNKDILTIY